MGEGRGGKKKKVLKEILLLLCLLLYPWLSSAGSVSKHHRTGEAGLNLDHSAESILPWEFMNYTRKEKAVVKWNNQVKERYLKY